MSIGTTQVNKSQNCIIVEMIQIGDHVSIPSHEKGTTWESGYVMNINRLGALIQYGHRNSGLYGIGERVPIDELVRLEK